MKYAIMEQCDKLMFSFDNSDSQMYIIIYSWIVR